MMLGKGSARVREQVHSHGFALAHSPLWLSSQIQSFLRGYLQSCLGSGSLLGETLPPRLHLSFPSEALPFSPRCWEDSVNSSLEVLEALGGETHYKYPAFIISLPGGTVLRVGEANTCRGRKSKCRALGALENWLLGATWAGEN